MIWRSNQTQAIFFTTDIHTYEFFSLIHGSLEIKIPQKNIYRCQKFLT